jgi:hypothetical protein
MNPPYPWLGYGFCVGTNVSTYIHIPEKPISKPMTIPRWAGVSVKGVRGKGKGTDIETLQKPLPLTRGTGLYRGGDLIFTKIITLLLQSMPNMSTVLSSVSILISILHHKRQI